MISIILMTTKAKVFASCRSQAIRLPKEFRVSGKAVQLSRVPGVNLISEADPWDAFEAGYRSLGKGLFDKVDQRDRKTPQRRNLNLDL